MKNIIRVVLCKKSINNVYIYKMLKKIAFGKQHLVKDNLKMTVNSI